MSPYMKKTWLDEVVESANRGETSGEKEVREILEYVVSSKEEDLSLEGKPPRGVSFELLRKLEKIHKQVYFHWEMFDRKPEERIINGQKQTVHVLSYTKKPYLYNVLLGDRDQKLLWDLIKVLQDRNWVGALHQCPECGNFLLSTAVWETRYCNSKCKKKYLTRKRRKREREERQWEMETFKCPGNNEPIDLYQCKQLRKLFSKYTCPTCLRFRKGGSKNDMAKD